MVQVPTIELPAHAFPWWGIILQCVGIDKVWDSITGGVIISVYVTIVLVSVWASVWDSITGVISVYATIVLVSVWGSTVVYHWCWYQYNSRGSMPQSLVCGMVSLVSVCGVVSLVSACVVV